MSVFQYNVCVHTNWQLLRRYADRYSVQYIVLGGVCEYSKYEALILIPRLKVNSNMTAAAR